MASLLKFTLLRPAEQVLNLAMRKDPHLLRTLYRQAPDKVITLQCTSLPGFEIGLHFTEQGLRLLSESDQAPAASITGPAAALLGLLTSDDPAAALHHPQLQLHGDVHLVQALHRSISRLELDWSDLFRNPAFQIASQAIKSSATVMRQSLNSLGMDTADYLQHESDLLPSRSEVNDFTARTEALRLRIDRLQARLAQIKPPASI
jgi:ubiquinone biosynthesis accessory factor UbiJ